ncbi:MAG: diaminopimelate decarboxylase [Verrucomicrobia bacterium]|jgi:diaminopimelate decarboxylase|nr:diaminopimelate decarboxylase [Verrucomicrobiota bacterium]
MHSFHYQRGKLTCESYPLDKAAERYGTPLYVYSSHTIVDHYKRLDQALHELHHEICYAVKANSNLAVIRLLAEQGAGFDIVSGGELYRVIKAGGNPVKCTFAGVGKSREEIEYALRCEVLSFNVESEQELSAINEIAKSLNKRAPIAIRVNPDVSANTHKYITTGKTENKFGIAIDRVTEVYRRARTFTNIKIRGVQMHIGSQITDSRPFVQAIEKMLPLVRQLKSDCGIEFFSIGGGIGIVYRGSLESGDEVWWKQDEPKHALTIQEYASAIVPLLKGLPIRVLLEPGRFLVGNAGVLLTRVLYVKRSPVKTFVIVDAGMNDLIRPALYQGYHEIVPVRESKDRPVTRFDVVGPVCESGDFFALDRELTEVEPGEVLALMSAGAYGFTMASNYNSRPLPAELLISGAEAKIVRRRQSYADLVNLEITEG